MASQRLLVATLVAVLAAGCGGTTKPRPDEASPRADGLTLVEVGESGSCTSYAVHRGGAAVEVPAAVEAALACGAPDVTPNGDGLVFQDESDLKLWRLGDAAPRSLTRLEPPGGSDTSESGDGFLGVSTSVWSPDGARLAVVLAYRYNASTTHLIVLDVSPAGAVTREVRHDVSVYSPCGSICTPEPPRWLDDRTIEVVNDDSGSAGARQRISL